MKKIWKIVIFILVFLNPIFWGEISAAKVKKYDLVLEKANSSSNPFTRLFYVNVNSPGVIRIYLKVKKGHKRLVFVKLFSVEEGDNKLLAQVRGDKGRIEYSIDDILLKKTKKFMISVSNFDVKRKQRVEVLVAYPVSGEEGIRSVYPDLAIEDISLDQECHVLITIVNKGPGRLFSRFWKKDSPTLNLYKNGKFWGGVSLDHFDPQKKLLKKGGSVVYRSNMILPKDARIKAQINVGPKIIDADLKNNIMEKKLTCLGLPDLYIEKIYLGSDCRVLVKIKNQGGFIPQSAWISNLNVYLYMNGRGWGGVALRTIDSDKSLINPGGVLIYRSNLYLRGKANVRAVVDKDNVLQEKNETNNKLEVRLSCQGKKR
ncbi:CARDB domain-containing protein [Thermosulfuriphilus sp.]